MRDLGLLTTIEIASNTPAFFWLVEIDTDGAGTYVRYTDRFDDYVDDGTIVGTVGTYTFSSYDVKVGAIVQNQQSPLDVSYIDVENADNVWSNFVLNVGSRFRACRIWQAWFDETTGALIQALLVFDGRTDEVQLTGTRAKVSLAPHRTPWDVLIPLRRFVSTCMYLFKDGDTCQYAGADTTCTRTIDDCTSKSNQAHFGGFNLLPPPNFKFVWGNQTVQSPPYIPPPGMTPWDIYHEPAKPPDTTVTPPDDNAGRGRTGAPTGDPNRGGGGPVDTTSNGLPTHDPTTVGFR